MTNDTTTLNGALRELGELMATNLETMGVEDVSADDGLTTLANEILNVEPSISGLELEMAVTLTCNKSVVNVGEEVTFISNLSAMYDDGTQTNVDLLGVITGATIIFKDANDNILGQAVTNGNGVAISNLTFVEEEDLIITAYFEGTQNFDSCNSESINLSVVNELTLTLTGNKEIMQNNETAILSSTLILNNVPLEDETVTFNIYNKGLLEETLNGITDANGIATVNYIGKGVGDIDIQADWNNTIQSETIAIEDCIFHDATEKSASTANSMTSGTIYSGLSLQLPQHFEWSVDMKVSSMSSSEDRLFLTATNHSGEQPPWAIFVQFVSNAITGGTRENSTIWSQGYSNPSANTYYNLKCERNGDTLIFSVNDQVIDTLTGKTWIDNYNSWWFSYSFWKRPYITGTWKNMKIKAL